MGVEEAISHDGAVSDFLSPEWLRELETAAAADAGLQGAAASVELSVAHEITGAPHGDVHYVVRFGPGGVGVVPGKEEADVSVRQSYATAAAISQGKLTPAEAFAAGLVKLGGRPGLLAQHRDLLGRLGDVFAGLRARTTY